MMLVRRNICQKLRPPLLANKILLPLDTYPIKPYIYNMKGRNKYMKKRKNDPVKDYQKECVDQRVCLFYVADRVKGILECKTDAKLRDELEEFKDECVHNIGTNALIERYEY